MTLLNDNVVLNGWGKAHEASVGCLTNKGELKKREMCCTLQHILPISRDLPDFLTTSLLHMELERGTQFFSFFPDVLYGTGKET